MEINSQLHHQVEVVWTLIDVLQRHDILMLDPVKQRNDERSLWYPIFAQNRRNVASGWGVGQILMNIYILVLQQVSKQ